MATAGADARIAIWTPGRQQPDEVLEGHRAPIVALAVSPDGATLASASWDRTVRLWPLRSGAKRVLEGHSQNVNGVAFTPDGQIARQRRLRPYAQDLAAAGWRTRCHRACRRPSMPLAVAADGEIATGGADGKVRFLTSRAKQVGEVQAGPTPIVALAISPDGALVAAAGIGGAVTIIDRKARSVVANAGRSGLAGLVRSLSARRRDIADGRRRWHDPALECADRRPRRLIAARHAGRSAGGLCRRSRRRSVQGVRRLSYPVGERRRARGPDACRIVRPQDRVAARLSLLRRAEKHEHRVDAGNGRQNCSSSVRTPIRPAPKCRSSASARRKIARRLPIFWPAPTAKIISPWCLARVRADNPRSCAAARARERRRTGRTAARSW